MAGWNESFSAVCSMWGLHGGAEVDLFSGAWAEDCWFFPEAAATGFFSEPEWDPAFYMFSSALASVLVLAWGCALVWVLA